MLGQAIRPKALQPGDCVGVVAPASPVSSDEVVYRSLEWLHRQGFRTKPGPSCFQRTGYLAGSDRCRADDLNAMFADPIIDGIICLKGGYGTPRILDLLDYETIAAHPKLFAGYSDITALLVAIYQRCHMVTFHGPMPASCMIPELDSFSHDSMLKAISTTDPIGQLVNPEGGVEIRTLVGGCAEGEMVGGNLSLIAAMMGTPYELDTRGKLLVLEEISEEEYRVDRMLTQLRLAGKLEQCAGIILGTWSGCHTENGYAGNQTLAEVFNDIVRPVGRPTIIGFQVGHCTPKITLPFGVRTRLDADRCTVEVLEPACS
ncbi:MAG: S66 peptidase family protein [Armatimonadota bacterium]